MFVTNYYRSNVLLPCVVIFIPKHSFCNTVCVCMVMQIKLVVVVVVVVGQPRLNPSHCFALDTIIL